MGQVDLLAFGSAVDAEDATWAECAQQDGQRERPPHSPQPSSRASGSRLRRGDFGAELAGNQMRVQAVKCNELGVAALLANCAIVQDHDTVGSANGGQPVGNYQRGPPRAQPVQRLANLRFTDRVKM